MSAVLGWFAVGRIFRLSGALSARLRASVTGADAFICRSSAWLRISLMRFVGARKRSAQDHQVEGAAKGLGVDWRDVSLRGTL